MGELKVRPDEHAAHLCIDMQRLFAPGGPWETPWLPRVLPSVIRLVERSPSRTIFARFITPLLPENMPGVWQAYYRKWTNVTRHRLDLSLLNLVPALERYVPPAQVFHKMVYSAFATGELHPYLRDRDIDTVIVTGSETDACVLASVLAGIDLGYRVIVARDCVCSSSDESHDSLIELYRRRFDVQIDIADSEEIVEAWRV